MLWEMVNIISTRTGLEQKRYEDTMKLMEKGFQENNKAILALVEAIKDDQSNRRKWF